MTIKYAIIFRGFSFCQTRKGVNWRLILNNLTTNLFEPLFQFKPTLEIDIFLVTYESIMQDQLVCDFQTLANQFKNKVKIQTCLFLPTNGESFNQRDTMLESLKSVNNPEQYNMLIIYRFDLYMLKPITEMNFVEDKINIAWRELAHYWRAHCRVCDLFFAFPGKYYTQMFYAISKHKDRTNLHKIYNILYEQNVEIHFMTPNSEFYDSNTDKKSNPFFRIVRSNEWNVCIP
jgi:hypothetical protein